MKKSFGIAFAALALCSALAAPAMASEKVQPASQNAIQGKTPPPPLSGEHHNEGPRGGFDGGPFKGLNLTADQKTQIEKIRKEHRATERQEIDKVLTTEQLALLKKNLDAHAAEFNKGPHGPMGDKGQHEPVGSKNSVK